DLVGICLDRSLEMIVGILGILKAGGAYVPIDPEYPKNRIDYMVKDSGIKILVSRSEIINTLKNQSDFSIICLERDWFLIEREDFQPLDRVSSPENLAYIIYTSGSTGNPKGVTVEHISLMNVIFSWKDTFGLDSQMNSLQVASLSFDVFLAEVSTSLLFGGSLILPSPSFLYSPEEFYELISVNCITILDLTPSLAIPLMDYIYDNDLDYSFLKILKIGSDYCKLLDFQRLLDRFGDQIQIFNCYGVTETTIDISEYKGKKSEGLKGIVNVPIGSPISNTQVYILDSNENLQPIGVVGELCVSGSGLARGYLNR
ncbi:AMP-binding protein, partial [Aquimarina sp. RZ0]|uniref:AMP-binding protein n=1 Tax=Aquimarina sp. RZ0 TaxID=2607730 RepID=UPI0011F26B15